MSPRAHHRPEHSRLVGVIDVGTNSTKLIVGAVHGDHVDIEFFARRPSRLGEGLTKSGRISPAAAQRTERDVRDLAALARSHHSAVIVAVGTFAFRKASNGEAVAQRIARRAGVPVRILTGREEATLAYLSALTRLRRPKPYTFLIDVGGGSTEFVAAHRGQLVRARSLPLGALRLTERHIHHDPIPERERRAMERAVDLSVRRVTAPFRRVPPAQIDLIVSGGSATTALSMLSPNSEHIPTARVTQGAMQLLAEACFVRTIAQRKRLPGLPTDRADIMPAGLTILLSFLRATRKRSLTVSDGGVREGVLISIDAEMQEIAHERAGRPKTTRSRSS